jgi:UDP-2,4-diacetamido-2,4,6-trideoxy-beta-L-altropyranose hydrolase|tara:strand:+ start:32 stop:1087 length:1056 start_codon:yes stop_codon:yes gene_type:complete
MHDEDRFTKNVVFRVDSSSKIGIGHLMRCITLADEMQQRGCKITFICSNLDGNLISQIKYKVVVLSKKGKFQAKSIYLDWLDTSQNQDAKLTIKAMPYGVDIIVVDSYALNQEWHRKLRPYTRIIMVIDDMADKELDCDILLNPNLNIQKSDYEKKVPKSCKLLLGPNFALLRPEFKSLRSKSIEKRKNTQKIQNILISMGGSDKNNITYDVLQQLSNEFNVTVVLGAASLHIEMIKEFAKDKNIKIIVNADNMSKLMLDADIAIGAGGSSTWERCCLGLPTLFYVLSPNQKRTADYLEEIKVVSIVRNLRQDIQKIIRNIDVWYNMSSKSQDICDGLGAIKVSDKLLRLE